MNSSLALPPRKPYWKRRTFWYGSFLGRVLLFSLASGLGSVLTGLFTETSIWLHGVKPHWWYWAFLLVVVNEGFMTVVGALFGCALCLATPWRQWSSMRKGRFVLDYRRRVLAPVFGGLTLTPLIVSAYCLIDNGGALLPASAHLPDALLVAEGAALPALSLIFGLWATHLSKKSNGKSSSKRAAVLSERLLPLD